MKAVDNGLGNHGFKLITLMRLTPLIPFNAFNYAIALTKVKLKHYILGSVGMIPGTALFVWIGVSLNSLS